MITMPDNRLNENEVSSLLRAFDKFSENDAFSQKQSTAFMVLLICINIYFGIFIAIFLLSTNELIFTPGQALNDEGLRTTLFGRTNVMFWLLSALNISVYFRTGFTLACYTTCIYAANVVIDNFIIFYDILIFENRPYFTVFAFSLPVVLVGIALLGLLHKKFNGFDEL